MLIRAKTIKRLTINTNKIHKKELVKREEVFRKTKKDNY